MTPRQGGTKGSDGQCIDMWTYGVAAALDRDWNALVYEGPGQGQMIFVDQVVFSPRWETVVAPLIDWLTARSDVDADRIALTGLSMGGVIWLPGPRPSNSASHSPVTATPCQPETSNHRVFRKLNAVPVFAAPILPEAEIDTDTDSTHDR
ncbi:alpha/beta hydrolase family protein [Streptomyces sp. NPDC002835]